MANAWFGLCSGGHVMRTTTRLLLILVATVSQPGLVSTVEGQAQQASAPPARIPPPTRPSTDRDNSASEYLQAAYRISAAEARRRLDLEKKISALAQRLEQDHSDIFGDMYITHEPQYAVVVRLTNPDQALINSLVDDQELRRAIKIQKANKPIKQLRAEQDEVMRELLDAGFQVNSTIDLDAETIEVISPNPTNIDQARSHGRVKLRENVRVKQGQLARHVQASQPSGSYPPQPGDWISAGFPLYRNVVGVSQADWGCTFGFGVKEGTQAGILTAGHCEPGTLPGNGTGYWHGMGHWIELWPPSHEFNTDPRYDFQFHPIHGMTVYNVVHTYDGQNYYVNSTLGYYGQKQGMDVCKYGHDTKWACGTIVDGNFYNSRKGASGYIRARNKMALNFAWVGDSGGPTFSPPSSGWITAYGVMTDAFKDTTAQYYDAVYMPIDYIDDVYPIQVLTTTMTTP